jgi:hypothetical protein
MLGILHPGSGSPVPEHGNTETRTIHELSKTETSVSDYLKRLGY